MRTQRSADIVSGGALTLLGFVVLVAASQITGGMEERLPPRTLPNIVGAALLVGGLALIWEAWRYRGPETPVGWPRWSGMLRNLVTLGALAAFVALLELLGTPLATALFVFGLVWYLRKRGGLSALLIGLICGAAIHLLFIQFLELSLPLGTLFR